jgi:hypothetical protein
MQDFIKVNSLPLPNMTNTIVSTIAALHYATLVADLSQHNPKTTSCTDKNRIAHRVRRL